jgi:hypothetical protein
VDWLDAHAGSVQAIATLVLVVLTAYYAWASRALVRETRATLQASARMTLQARLDRISELFLRDPELFASLNDPHASGDEEDGRFHVASMLVAVLEEAFTQHHLERSMTEEDWRAWLGTLDNLMQRQYIAGFWRRVRPHYNASFREFVDTRLRLE